MTLGFQSDKTTQVFSEGQSVDSSISSASPKELVKLVDRCIGASEIHRNRFGIMTGSYLQDAVKCKDLYEGILYSQRKKKPHECKADEYAYYVDFNATLMQQFDWKDHVKQVDEANENQSDEKNALDSESMTRLIKYCFDKSGTKEKEEDMLRFLGIYGNGIYKFQPFEEAGQVWPGHDIVDPRYIGCSPGATDVQDAVYMYYRRPVATADIKQAYPNMADEIRPDKEVTFEADKTTSNPEVLVSMGMAAGQFANVIGNAFKDVWQGGEKEFQQTKLTEFYYKDPEVITINDEASLDAWLKSNPGFGSEYTQNNIKNEYLKKLMGGPFEVKKYPHGRVLMMASNVLLDDYPNPYPIFPFINIKCYRRPKEFWAKGVIHKVREPVQNKQLITSELAANVKNRLQPPYYMTGANGAEVGKMKRVPTESNVLINLGTAQGASIMPLPIPQIAPPDVTAVGEMRRGDAERTAGLEGVLGGVNQTGTYSGVQYEKQLEQAMGKVAPRYKEVNRSREELGMMYLWFIQNYITDNRQLAFLSDQDQMIYMELNQQVANDSQLSVVYDVTKGKYKYYIEAGVNRPTTKQERASNVQAMSEIIAEVDPALAAEMQLVTYDVPGKWEWIHAFRKRVEENKQNAQAQQQMEQNLKTAIERKKAEIQERDMRNKEMSTEAANTKIAADIVQGLATAGVKVPMELVQQILLTTQFDLSEAQKGAAV